MRQAIWRRAAWAALVLTGAGAMAAGDWPPAPLVERPAQVDAGALPPSVTATPAATGWRCTFRFKPGPEAKAVSLAGTFNDWNAGATPMIGPRGDGYWLAAVELAGGRHEYKFVVDGQDWRNDPENPARAPNEFGTGNSLLRLGATAQLSESPSVAGDGEIHVAGLVHNPDLPLYFQPLAGDRALVRLKTLANDLEGVAVAVRNGPRTAMQVVHTDPLTALWQAEVTVPAAARTAGQAAWEYTFVLRDGGLVRSGPAVFAADYAVDEIFTTPDWAKHAVWYQIMPDRFRNGSRSNDPPRVHPWTSAWFTPTSWERQREREAGQSFYQWYVFDRLYGGDFQGLIEKLPYLKRLGVNALYLNPVFIGDSHHKYNATNYLHIDPDFGVGRAQDDYEEVVAQEDLLDPSTWKLTRSDAVFLRFLEAAHAADMKVIIDGVFNHVGTQHPAFVDVRARGRESRYADWFDVTSWEPFAYNGWGGFGALPAFAKTADGLASESLAAHIFAVTRRWMDPNGDGDPRDGIDGWRLDVPGEIPAPFWAQWREHVKSINREAYIVGEIWDRADSWLDGEHFDAVMNYQFARAVLAWSVNQERKISVSELDRRLEALRLAYPQAATLVLQNLMNSHDTDRLVSMALNPDRPYDHGNRIQDNGPNYNNAKPPPSAYRRARLIALLQMTYSGAPMVYYGDEAGMWGADDPTCRKPMLWQDLEPYDEPEENHVMEDHLAFYRAVIALRNAHPALRVGTFRTVLTDDEADVWAFVRSTDEETLLVALNNSDQRQAVTIPVADASTADAWHGLFGFDGRVRPRNGGVTVTVPSVAGVVLQALP